MTLIQAQLKERIGTIALYPYAKRNTLGADLIAEMLGTLDEFASEGVGVVVIRSASNERVWSAGHDVAALPLADADPISAERALRAGFVNEVLPEAELEERVYAMARTIASRSAAAVAVAKQAMHDLSDALAISPDTYERIQGLRRRLFRT